MEEEYVKTAKKYIPDLTSEQESLVRSLARCPNFNGDNDKARLDGRESLVKECFCKLDLMCNVYEIKRLLTNNSQEN